MKYSTDKDWSRKEFGKETSSSQTLRSWKSWTRQTSVLEGLNAKERIMMKNVEHFYFPIRRWNSKTVCLEETMGSENPFLRRDQPVRSEDLREDLQGNSEKSQPVDETKDDAEVRNDLLVNWRRFHLSSSRRIWSSTRRVERKMSNITEVYWRDQDNEHTFRRVAKKSSWRLLERKCGSKLVRLMDRIHEVCTIVWKTSKMIFLDDSQKFKQLPDLMICDLTYGPTC